MQLVVCIRRCTGGVYGHGAMSQHGQTASAPFANRQPCVRQELQQGPPHSWKQLHKLVNLEGRSLFPHSTFFSIRYLNDETGRGQTWCTQTSLYEADAHLQRRHTVHQGKKVEETGVLPQWTCISLTAGHRGGYCMFRSGCCSVMDNTRSAYLPELNASQLNLLSEIDTLARRTS